MNIKPCFKLSIAVCIISFISLSLLSLTGCSNNNEQTNNQTPSNELSSSSTSASDFTLGNYYIQIDSLILNNGEFITGDEGIEFLEDNQFRAYIGSGNGILGNYVISGNEINCTANEAYSEYGPLQEINVSLTFKMNSNSEIELLNASESYKVHVVDIPNNALTAETKDMSLWPFVKGTKFMLPQ